MKLRSLLPAAIRKSYLRKFGLAVAVIAVVVTGAGLAAQGAVAAELTGQQDDALATSAEQEAQTLDRWVSEQEQATRLISNHRYVSDAAAARIETTLRTEWSRRGEAIGEAHLVSLTTNRIERSTNASMEGQSVREMGMAWERGTLVFDDENDVARSKVYRWNGEYHLAFASKVPERNQAVVLTYAVETRAAQFRTSINGTRTHVVDGAGEVQFAENESRVFSRYSDGAEQQVVADSRNGSVGVVKGDGEVFAYAAMTQANWVVVKRVPATAAYALRDTVQRDLFGLIGLALLCFIAFGAFVGWDIRRSLTGVRSRVEALAAGRLDDDPVETDRLDEIGQVQNACTDIEAYLGTVADQADALAAQEFDDDALEADVPGRLGQSLREMRADLQQFIDEIETAKADAETAQREAEALADSLNRQAEEFSAVMEKAADGDLTQRLDADTDNDAMADIAAAFNGMLAELERTVRRIRTFAADVDDSAAQITASAAEVRDASQEVSESVQEIADGAETQYENIEETADEMAGLSATIEEVAAQADEVASTSTEAADIGVTGSERAEEAAEVMSDIEMRADETIDRVESLDEEMAEIGEIVDLIDDIAEQTNMLALNASIEAARAGEAGEGFAVVADEIKGLAQETTEATKEVSTVIESVQATTDETVTDIRQMGASVTDGIDTVDDAIESLEAIVDRVEDVNDGMQSISDATDEQAASTEETVSMIDEVGTISEESASQAETVAAAAEEQTATLTEVTGGIESLSAQAGDLSDLLQTFDVGDEQSQGETAVSNLDATEAAADDD